MTTAEQRGHARVSTTVAFRHFHSAIRRMLADRPTGVVTDVTHNPPLCHFICTTQVVTVADRHLMESIRTAGLLSESIVRFLEQQQFIAPIQVAPK